MDRCYYSVPPQSPQIFIKFNVDMVLQNDANLKSGPAIPLQEFKSANFNTHMQEHEQKMQMEEITSTTEEFKELSEEINDDLNVTFDCKERMDHGTKSFQLQFMAFAKFGNPRADGKTIALSQSDKWLKQAHVIDGEKISIDAMIEFKKFKKLRLSFGEYKQYLFNLANIKQVEMHEMTKQMCDCGPPETHVSLPDISMSPTFKRLTDPRRYTGTHKQRFDGCGRGRGLAGREDIVDNSGYVNGYKHKNTFNINN